MIDNILDFINQFLRKNQKAAKVEQLNQPLLSKTNLNNSNFFIIDESQHKINHNYKEVYIYKFAKATILLKLYNIVTPKRFEKAIIAL